MRVDLRLQRPDLRLVLLLLFLLILLNQLLQPPRHAVEGMDHDTQLSLSYRHHMDIQPALFHQPHSFHRVVYGVDDIL